MTGTAAPPPAANRILVVEDEAMSRAFIADLLRKDGFEVSAHATAAAASRAFASFRPVGIVADIELGDGPSGIHLIVALKKRSPSLAVVLLSNYAIAPGSMDASLADVVYLRKRDLDDPRVLLTSLRTVLGGDARTRMDGRDAAGRLAALTEVQADVLRMVAAGLSNDEIALQRSTTVKSVENTIHRVFAALGVHPDPSRNARVLAARIFIKEAGLPEPPA